LVFLRSYEDEGTETTKLHGFSVRMAKAERVLLDAAGLPQRMGGIPGLARVLDRATDRANWATVVRLSKDASRARAGLRRLAAMLEILGRAVPNELARVATAHPGETPLFLGERRIYGARGKRLARWQVVVNVDPGILREELSR
jgi:predicted transcriptional regulator of viral defense system